MSDRKFKNIYMEKVSGNFKSFDYNLNADISDNGVAEISAFINNSHINFNDMINDFKTMLGSLKSHYEFNPYNFKSEAVNPENKEYEINIDPNECAVSIQIFSTDFKRDNLIQNFAYAVGYIQSFLLHSEVISNIKKKEGVE